MHTILKRPNRVLQIAAAIFPFVGFAYSAHADIYQWQYINPADPNLGKQRSTTLAPDGAGVDAVPGADVSYRSLTMAYLIGADLTGANGVRTNLTDADLSQTNLTNACLERGILTGAEFSGATVRGASFAPIVYHPPFIEDVVLGTGINLEQLYSTASYQARDLSSIGLSGHNLTDANLSGQNLRHANFGASAIYSEYSREAATLTRAILTAADLRGASFYAGELAGANFAGAEIQGANFGRDFWVYGSGITLTQLYSTASFQAHDLRGIDVGWNDLTSADFAGQNLTDSDFGSEYYYYDLAWHVTYATLTGADFSGADTRGARNLNLSAATTTNLIRPDGSIIGLDLDAGRLLVVRDYDAYGNPIPITLDQHLAMGAGGTLRMVFEADNWDSTISFAPGIPVTLGGTLELTFAADVNLASQVGRTFDLFDWTGVNPTGAYAISSPYTWNLSNLYTTGEVTLTAVSEPANFALAAAAAFGAFTLRRNRSTHKANSCFSPINQFRRKLMASPTDMDNRNALSLNRSADMLTKLVALVLAIGIQQSSSHAAALRTVALTGQTAPGTTGGTMYGSFGSYYDSLAGRFFRGPVLNDAGQTAFRADLNGSGVGSANNQGVWSEGSGGLSLVARTGAHAPGVPAGVNFRIDPALELFSPVVNSTGQTAFYGGLTDGSVGIWSEGSGSLDLVARSGVQAPDAPIGTNLSFSAGLSPFHLDWPKLNDAGQTAFMGALTGAGVTSTNNWGVWSNGSGNLALVARAGDQAPGTPTGMVYGVSIAAAPIPAFVGGLNDVGNIALWANLAGSGVVGNDSYGYWSGGAGSLALVARKGDPASATPGGVSFDVLTGPVAFNNADQIAFGATLTGSGVNSTNDQGLWSNRSGSLARWRRKGSPAAGTPNGVNYLSFTPSYPVLNDGGQIAFRANITGSGVDSTNNLGIWSDSSDAMALVARTGSQAPGTTDGIKFLDLHFPALNRAGQTAFRANLIGGGVDFTDDRGIWATDASGALRLIVRTGELLQVAPGDFRTPSDLDFVTATGNGDSRPSAFNNLGQLVFWASFTDGSQGIFVSNAVAHVPGDFNNNGLVDAADYDLWKSSFGSSIDGAADGNGNGIVDAADYSIWRDHLGQTLGAGSGAAIPSAASLSPAVPEPASILLAVTGLTALIQRIRRRTGIS